MKKKTPQLKKLSLQKTAITILNAKANMQVLGGASGPDCVAISLPNGALSCIGHTCESWNSERPSCWEQCTEA